MVDHKYLDKYWKFEAKNRKVYDNIVGLSRSVSHVSDKNGYTTMHTVSESTAEQSVKINCAKI